MRNANFNDGNLNFGQIKLCSAKMALFAALLLVPSGCGGGAGAPTALSAAGVASVAQLTPDNGITEVATSGTVSATFNAKMDAATITDRTFQVTGPDGNISGTVSYDGSNMASFTPTAPLLPQTTYTATLTTDIKDASGKPLSGNRSWNFKTGKDTLARTGSEVITSKFFGQHLHRANSSTVWPGAKFGTWRLWDADVTWPDLEPLNGQWNFTTLDKYLALAEQHGVDVIMPLGLTPAWASKRPTETCYYGPGNAAEPTNLDDWKTYVRTVATQYKGRIHYYEIWNEPNLKGFYTGTVDEMVTLANAAYTTIKEIDPSAQVISPSATNDTTGLTWLNQYLTLGGAGDCDVIGYHLYVPSEAPEAMITLYKKVAAIVSNNNAGSKPFWNTESGWYIQNNAGTVKSTPTFTKVLTDSDSSAYVARAFILNWASGIDRFMWYAWDNQNMGFVEQDGKTVKSAGVAYAQIVEWLVGSKMLSCGQSTQGNWVVKIQKANGGFAWIVWNTAQSATMQIPNEWNTSQARDLTGATVKIPLNKQLTVGQGPILLES